MIHLLDHWVCITNYNPWLYPNEPLGIWHVYDSIQNPDKYCPLAAKIIAKFTDGDNCQFMYVVLPKQIGSLDCGLFALGYATALCLNINPATLKFDQTKMRHEFNQIISFFI